MRTVRSQVWLVVGCVGVAAMLGACSYVPHAQPTEKQVAAAEDEVYAAVVRDMFPPNQTGGVKQLVFEQDLLTGQRSGVDRKACEEEARTWLAGASNSTPQYNTLADQIYRFFHYGWHDAALRPETLESFVQRSCIAGHLSTTFHTDLPRAFVDAEKIEFAGWQFHKNRRPSFQELFPGAGGVLSFSHVGFDANLNEAIVSTSYVCGGLCGTGHRYFLKRRRGKWQVVDKPMVWVS